MQNKFLFKNCIPICDLPTPCIGRIISMEMLGRSIKL